MECAAKYDISIYWLYITSLGGGEVEVLFDPRMRIIGSISHGLRELHNGEYDATVRIIRRATVLSGKAVIITRSKDWNHMVDRSCQKHMASRDRIHISDHDDRCDGSKMERGRSFPEKR